MADSLKRRVRQILQEFAKEASNILATSPDISSRAGFPTLHRGFLVRPEAAAARFEVLEKLDNLIARDHVWSRAAIDDVLLDFIQGLFDLSAVDRQTGIGRVVDEIADRFLSTPSPWTVDILVYGCHSDCSGVRFGRVSFFTEDIGTEDSAYFPDFPAGPHVLAHLQTTAVNEESAIRRAEVILDEHLMILNALCAREVPSQIQVSRTDHIRPLYSAVRVGPPNNGDGHIRPSGHHHKIPISGSELREITDRSLGTRIGEMLTEETEFNRRVLLGYQFVGAACVDHHPERSFLMLAIALESTILGNKAKTEITYQLGARVAHLIGKGLDGRKLVSKTVNDLYDRRSRIVHAGQYGISPKEASLMFFYCIAALSMLARAPTFRDFSTNDDLDQWFKNRILEGPDHYRAELDEHGAG